MIPAASLDKPAKLASTLFSHKQGSCKIILFLQFLPHQDLLLHALPFISGYSMDASDLPPLEPVIWLLVWISELPAVGAVCRQMLKHEPAAPRPWAPSSFKQRCLVQYHSNVISTGCLYRAAVNQRLHSGLMRSGGSRTSDRGHNSITDKCSWGAGSCFYTSFQMCMQFSVCSALLWYLTCL